MKKVFLYLLWSLLVTGCQEVKSSNFVPEVVSVPIKYQLSPQRTFTHNEDFNVDKLITGNYDRIEYTDLPKNVGQHEVTLILKKANEKDEPVRVTYEIVADDSALQKLAQAENSPIYQENDGIYHYRSQFYKFQQPVVLRDDYLDLINKEFYLASDYVPADLVAIDNKYCINKNLYIRQVVYDAFLEMHQAALNDGVELYILSAYRSYDYQSEIYHNYLANDPQGADTYSARPGFSEHQSGLAFDFASATQWLGSFEKTPQDLWLRENADKFGFILRYPENTTEITGYQYESWHYRYVGKEVAKKVKQSQMTYEQYYVNILIDN